MPRALAIVRFVRVFIPARSFLADATIVLQLSYIGITLSTDISRSTFSASSLALETLVVLHVEAWLAREADSRSFIAVGTSYVVTGLA